MQLGDGYGNKGGQFGRYKKIEKVPGCTGCHWYGTESTSCPRRGIERFCTHRGLDRNMRAEIARDTEGMVRVKIQRGVHRENE